MKLLEWDWKEARKQWEMRFPGLERTRSETVKSQMRHTRRRG